MSASNRSSAVIRSMRISSRAVLIAQLLVLSLCLLSIFSLHTTVQATRYDNLFQGGDIISELEAEFNTSSTELIIIGYNQSDGWGWNGTCPYLSTNCAAVTTTTTSSSSLARQFGDGFGAWLGFFFITIAASQCALIVKFINLPLITGYMFFGVIVGPQMLEMVTKNDLSYLSPITQFALAFISLSAGAELYLPELRALFRRIISITMIVSAVCFFVCLGVIYALAAGGLIPFMTPLSKSCQFSIALVAASVMVTQSPSSAIAVVAEAKAKGPFTSTMLGITVLTDIVVLLMYSICSAIANANCSPEANGFRILDLVVTVGCILAAGGIGYAFGKLIIFLIWVPRIHGEWAVLPLGFAIFRISSWFNEWSTEQWGTGINFDPLLICIFAGYIVANHSRNRRKFLRFLGRCGPIIFIPFFTLTGCGLNLKVMGQSAGFAVIVFSVRAATFALGSYIGGHYTGMEKLQLQTLWISMLTQAGVSLGIAAEVAIAFPDWGKDFQSTVVSVILINQVIGPVACKWALKKNGEDGVGAEDDEEDDEEHIKRCVIIGINISSLAVAQRLLKQDWNVLFIDSDIRKVDMLQWLQYEPRKKKEKTAAEIAKAKKRAEARENRRRLREAAMGKEVAPSTFKDLNPPESSGAESSPESVNAPLVPSSPSSSSLDPIHEHSDHVELSVEERFNVKLDASGAVQSPATSSSINTVDPNTPDYLLTRKQQLTRSRSLSESGNTDLNNTTTPPEEKQVQFRLLKAEAVVPSDLPISKMKYRAEAYALQQMTADCNPSNVEAAIVMLEMDELNFELCQVLQDNLHLKRIVVEIQNPNWTSMFASLGIYTVFPYSLSSHTLFQLVAGHIGRPEIINPNKPLHVSLSHIIKPDTIMDNPPLYLRQLSAEDQETFLKQHPDPPLPRSQLWKFDEKVSVVSAAQRDEYLHQIQELHGNNSIELNHFKAADAAEMTFSGPGMLNVTGGGVDPDDPESVEEERKFNEARARQKAQARQSSVKMAGSDDQYDD